MYHLSAFFSFVVIYTSQNQHFADPSGRAVYKAWVCGRSLAGITGSNPAGGVDVYLL
jgi:hypothetical protein